MQAFVQVVTREELETLARASGSLAFGRTANGLAIWHQDGGACFVYLAADPRGLAALEHELWHCKAGAWHD